jgi:Electron transfer flavoprotein, beta subunit
MKILVAIKRVVDYNVRVQVKPDGSGVATDGVKMSINPFDEIAVEEALRIKEQGKADEVVVVTIGDDASQQQLRTAMAMGADRAILVNTDQPVQPLQAAQVLLKVIEKEQPGLVITGKQRLMMTTTKHLKCWPPCGTVRKPPLYPKLSLLTRAYRPPVKWMPAWKPLRLNYPQSFLLTYV